MSVKDDIEHHSSFKLGDEEQTDTLPTVVEESATVEDTELEQDFQYARSNIKELVKKGSISVDEILKIAKASDHPRAFEVAAGFLKQLADMNQQILDLHKKKKDIQIKTGEDQSKIVHNTQNNIMFHGSTHDMQKMLRERGAEIIAEVEAEMAEQEKSNGSTESDSN